MSCWPRWGLIWGATEFTLVAKGTLVSCCIESYGRKALMKLVVPEIEVVSSYEQGSGNNWRDKGYLVCEINWSLGSRRVDQGWALEEDVLRRNHMGADNKVVELSKPRLTMDGISWMYKLDIGMFQCSRQGWRGRSWFGDIYCWNN